MIFLRSFCGLLCSRGSPEGHRSPQTSKFHLQGCKIKRNSSKPVGKIRTELPYIYIYIYKYILISPGSRILAGLARTGFLAFVAPGFGPTVLAHRGFWPSLHQGLARPFWPAGVSGLRCTRVWPSVLAHWGFMSFVAPGFGPQSCVNFGASEG